ncbi:ATP-dependent Clp protease adapter ClpS [Acidiphilium sp.]|uniref:ATP-dependent Clp protease adapter ClpS n=1 Tax=Acidiphilium sp. TaxID=527 RepID=UPI003D0270E5
MSDFRRNLGNDDGIAAETRITPQRPPLYKVLMLNDDYTPMDFVVHALERFFAKSPDEAARITVNIHRRGSGLCGVFTYDIAETKMIQVTDLARQNQHPLQCSIEKT